MRLGVASLVAAAAITIMAPVGARRAEQRLGSASPDQYPNFDIRKSTDTVAVAYMSRFAALQSSPARAALASAQSAGLARLQSNFAAIEVVNNPELGTPEVLGRVCQLVEKRERVIT